MPDFGIFKYMTKTGTVVPFFGEEIPTGWLLCNGAWISREDYPALFDVLSAWGTVSDDGSEVQLPDCRGKVLQGADSTNSLGVEVDAGLPGIAGALNCSAPGPIYLWSAAGSGALYNNYSATDYHTYSTGSDTVQRSSDNCVRIDASKSSSIYGASSTVQPQATCSNYMIRC